VVRALFRSTPRKPKWQSSVTPDYRQEIAVTQVFIHIPHDAAEAPDIDDMEEGGV
jgi:hypothetical protein